MLQLGLLEILCVGLWIWALVDILRSNFRDPNGKLIWCLVVILLPLLGALLYLAIGKDQKSR